MLTIFCTKAATEALTSKRGGVIHTAVETAGAGESADITPSAWQCHAVTIERKRVLVLMQADCRFVLFLWGISKGDDAVLRAKVQARMIRHQRQYAQRLGLLDEAQIDAALQAYAANLDIRLIDGQTSRSVQSHMNDAVSLLKRIVADKGLPPDEDAEVFCEYEINRGLRSIKGGEFFYPDEAWHLAWLRDVVHADDDLLARADERWRDIRRQWLDSLFDLHGSQALSPAVMADLARLDELMLKAGKNCMNLATLDGFFAALVSAPNLVMPSQYLEVVWDGEWAFESQAHAEETMSLLMGHWNRVVGQLQHCVESQMPFEPFLYEPEEGEIPGGDWALGYVAGMSFWIKGWEPCFKGDELEMLLSPIFLLMQATAPELATEGEAESYSQDDYYDMLEVMMMTVPVIHALFEPYRHGEPLPAVRPVRKSSSKVGRKG